MKSWIYERTPGGSSPSVVRARSSFAWLKASLSISADDRSGAMLFRQADPLSQSRQIWIAGKQRRQFRRIQVLAGALRAARGHSLDGIDRPILVAETRVDERFLVGTLWVRDHPLRFFALPSARER